MNEKKKILLRVDRVNEDMGTFSPAYIHNRAIDVILLNERGQTEIWAQGSKMIVREDVDGLARRVEEMDDE